MGSAYEQTLAPSSVAGRATGKRRGLPRRPREPTRSLCFPFSAGSGIAGDRAYAADVDSPAVADRRPERYRDALRHGWRAIVACGVAALAVALLYSLVAASRYEATADLIVTPIAAGDETFVGIPLLRESSQTRNVLAVVRMVENPVVARQVRSSLGLTEPTSDLLDRVTAEPREQSGVVAVRARAGSASEAAALANAFVDEAVALRGAQFQRDLRSAVQRLEAQLGAASADQRAAFEERLVGLRALLDAPDPTLGVLVRAVPPDEPYWPRPLLAAAAALLGGLLVGAAAVMLLELTSPRVLSERDLVTDYSVPVLASIPRVPEERIQASLRQRAPLPEPAAEAYRGLRAELGRATEQRDGHVTVLVTSAGAREGKTTTAASLAAAAARAGLRTVLVDGNLRRPAVGELFGASPRQTDFGDVLLDASRLGSALVASPALGKHLALLLPDSGGGDIASVEALTASRLTTLVERLARQADLVVFDSPPLAEFGDALALAEAVDLVVVAVRLGETRRRALDDVVERLAQRGVRPTGFVVTGRRGLVEAATSAWRAVRRDREERPADSPLGLDTR